MLWQFERIFYLCELSRFELPRVYQYYVRFEAPIHIIYIVTIVNRNTLLYCSGELRNCQTPAVFYSFLLLLDAYLIHSFRENSSRIQFREVRLPVVNIINIGRCASIPSPISDSRLYFISLDTAC